MVKICELVVLVVYFDVSTCLMIDIICKNVLLLETWMVKQYLDLSLGSGILSKGFL